MDSTWDIGSGEKYRGQAKVGRGAVEWRDPAEARAWPGSPFLQGFMPGP